MRRALPVSAEGRLSDAFPGGQCGAPLPAGVCVCVCVCGVWLARTHGYVCVSERVCVFCSRIQCGPCCSCLLLGFERLAARVQHSMFLFLLAADGAAGSGDRVRHRRQEREDGAAGRAGGGGQVRVCARVCVRVCVCVRRCAFDGKGEEGGL